ncbi:hypothetical protein [Rhodoferax sp.]|uniref:hypothetical protein n=1 Tax=Rhodoferax sp. TaxID=50421 RepID=UPI0027570117|nr:hypothetical protein [Rhodoferax sp.]
MKIQLAAFLLIVAAQFVSAQTAVKPSKSRQELKSQANQMAAGVRAAEAALSPAELDIARRVQVGRLPCELGTSVTLAADPRAPGYFDVTVRNLKFRMFPVETTTGAIRLEDRKAGALWLQLANKSMLMNQKLGQRLADGCVSADQAVVAESLNRNPAPSVLDAQPANAAATAASQAVGSTAK